MIAVQARKPWVKQECKPNSKPVRIPMHVRLGDTVQVIAGDDKGKVGEVVEVLTKKGKVVVREVNMTYRTVPPRGEDAAGSVIRKESPIPQQGDALQYEGEGGKPRRTQDPRRRPKGANSRQDGRGCRGGRAKP